MGRYDAPQIVMRPATESDGSRCAEIFLAARILAFPWQPAGLFRLGDYYDCVVGEEVWVAEVAGFVVCFVSIDRIDSFIHNLFVEPSWQHRGIGTRLLDMALRRLDGSAHLTCGTRNRPARAFYERNGWVAEASSTTALGPYVLYRK